MLTYASKCRFNADNVAALVVKDGDGVYASQEMQQSCRLTKMHASSMLFESFVNDDAILALSFKHVRPASDINLHRDI